MKIKKETGRSYLVIDLTDEETDEEAFSLRMLTENRIKGLLPMRIRSINDKRSLYADVTDLAPLAVFCKNRQLSGSELGKLFQAISSIIRRLPDYFIDPSGLSFAADSIYTDGNEFSFCYLPGKSALDDGNAAEELARELIVLIDNDDSDAVFLGYGFYRTARESGGSIALCISRVLDTEKNESDRDTAGDDDKGAEEDTGSAGYRDVAGEDDSFGEGQSKRSTPDVLQLMIFIILTLLGILLCYKRVMHISPFSFMLMMGSGDGIAGVVFIAAGLAGTGLTIAKS